MRNLVIIFISIIIVGSIYAAKEDSPEIIMKKYFQACLKEDLKTLKELITTHFGEGSCYVGKEIDDMKMQGQAIIWYFAESRYSKVEFKAIKNVNEIMNFEQKIKDDRAFVILKHKGKGKLWYTQFNFKKINGVWINVGVLFNDDNKDIFGTFNWEEETSELIEPDGSNE